MAAGFDMVVLGENDIAPGLALKNLLGGPWDLVTTYSWVYSPTDNPPRWTYRGHPNYT